MKAKFLSILFIVVSFSLKAQNETLEDKIVDTIFRLREVKSMSAKIKRETNGKHHLLVYVDGRPSKEVSYYKIKVWEDNGHTDVTIFEFLVYTNPFEIKYYDSANDSAISLAKWRKRNEK